MKKRNGQILILVLLIVVVALAVGLSVASRNITNLRISTQTEQSQRAFTVAEGGVEDVLSRLSSIAADPQVLNPGGKNENVAIGDLQANVNVKASSVYEAAIEPGEVGQVDLKNSTNIVGATKIRVEWARKTDSSESAQPASIEWTLVKDLGGGNYSQERGAISGGSFPGRDETGLCTINCGECISAGTDFAKCIEIPFDPAGDIILRLKPFWVKTTFRVSGVNVTLAIQTYELTSQATTEIGVTRKVQVTRTALPQLPAAFDYVLYSEGDIIK